MTVEELLRDIAELLGHLVELSEVEWVGPNTALDGFAAELVALAEKWKPILELEVEVL